MEKGELNPPLMEFGKGRFMTDTMRAFADQKLEPYEYPEDKTLDLVLILPKGDARIPKVLKIYDNLEKGGGEAKLFRSYFPGFMEVFNVKLRLKSTQAYESETEAKSKINALKKTDRRHPIVVVIGIKERTSGCGIYQNLKIHTIRQEIPSQFITMSVAERYESDEPAEKGNLLWNLGMGLYAKMNVLPWKLKNPLEGIAAVIGLSTIAESSEGVMQRKGISIVQVFNNWGNPSGRFLGSHHSLQKDKKGVWVTEEPRKEFEFLSEGLNLVSNYVLDPEDAKKNHSIIVHMTDRYSDSVIDEIERQITENGYQKYKIIKIQDKGVYRKFDSSKTKQKAWPYQGSFTLDTKKNSAYLFTRGKWRYYQQAYSIESDNIIPLRIELVRGHSGTILDREDLFHIYQLTRLNYGTADVVQTGIPISIKFAKKSAELAMCGLVDIDYSIRHLY